MTPPTSVFAGGAGIISGAPAATTVTESWASSLSTSLGSLATQFAQASQALAAVPAGSASGAPQLEGLAIIQQAQTRLEQELESLKEQVAYLRENRPRSEKEKEKAAEAEAEKSGAEDFENRLQAVEKHVEDVAETIRLE